MRCGRPSGHLDVGAALASVGEAGEAQLVPAACIVDADVEIDFSESCESEGAQERARVAAAALEAERQRQAAAAAAEAAAKQDPWSVQNAGSGHVLGGGEQSEEAQGDAPAMSERDKRLAALERRGL